MRATISALLLALAVWVPSARADLVSDGIARMPVEVITLRLGGTWQSGGGTGYYRFVLARSPVQASAARLFVQWIQNGGAGDAVISSVEVAEIAQKPTRVTDLRLETAADGTNAFVDTLDLGTGAPDELMLMLGAPGTYRLAPLSN